MDKTLKQVTKFFVHSQNETILAVYHIDKLEKENTLHILTSKYNLL